MGSDTPETSTDESSSSENASAEIAASEKVADKSSANLSDSGEAPVASDGDQSDDLADDNTPSAPNYTPTELDAGTSADDSPKAEVNLDLVLDVPVNISLRVGSADISIRDLVRLVEGSVIALEQDAAEPMDVLVNGTLIAHGEIVVVDDRFGVRLIDVVGPVERVENLNGADQAA